MGTPSPCCHLPKLCPVLGPEGGASPATDSCPSHCHFLVGTAFLTAPQRPFHPPGPPDTEEETEASGDAMTPDGPLHL